MKAIADKSIIAEFVADVAHHEMDKAQKRVGLPKKAGALLFAVFRKYLDVVDTIEDVDAILSLLETLPGLIKEHKEAMRRFKVYVAVQIENAALSLEAEARREAALKAFYLATGKAGFSKKFALVTVGQSNQIKEKLEQISNIYEPREGDTGRGYYWFRSTMAKWRLQLAHQRAVSTSLNKYAMDSVIH